MKSVQEVLACVERDSSVAGKQKRDKAGVNQGARVPELADDLTSKRPVPTGLACVSNQMCRSDDLLVCVSTGSQSFLKSFQILTFIEQVLDVQEQNKQLNSGLDKLQEESNRFKARAEQAEESLEQAENDCLAAEERDRLARETLADEKALSGKTLMYLRLKRCQVSL